MNNQKNYHSYIVINGEEWMSSQPMDLNNAYDDAVRMKTERNADQAGVKVFTQGCMIIINWKEGLYWRGKPSYLYKIII